MKRAFYSNTIRNFISDSTSQIIGDLSLYYSNHNLSEFQINAWKAQIEILKKELIGIVGKIYFEFTIPRMGKRVDNVIIVKDTIFVLEFKVGEKTYDRNAIEQVIDYAIDLINFHEGSHYKKVIPVLVATEAKYDENLNENVISNIVSLNTAVKTNKDKIKESILKFVGEDNPIDVNHWENSIYKPTPTIIEAAQALYKGHNVKEITRSDAGAINLSRTASCIKRIVENSKKNNVKSICFISGVPGAGKTLAGLNIANERMNADESEHAVFLSGNGPLVKVLREALTRDHIISEKEKGNILSKKKAAIKANAFIQNIHHFRDDNLLTEKPPIEKVVVFDEAQRAWTKEQLNHFMKRKKGYLNFNKSEPEFLIEIMDLHKDWCTIICLVGGGQEINTGEAGLEEWVFALKNRFNNWKIHLSNLIIENNDYLRSDETRMWLKNSATIHNDLHLAVSVRSFRSEKLSLFVNELLELNISSAKAIYEEIKSEYFIFLTRNLDVAKKWLIKKARGSERYGIVASSGSRRLRPYGIDVKNEINAAYWFLNDKEDVRSSYFLEDIATEFDIQGLEIDWACVAWGANFYIENNNWKYQSFKGAKWQNIRKELDMIFLKNAYRVLLTRARQGMIIYIPEGCEEDKTRVKKYFDGTFNYLKKLGIKEIVNL